MFTGIITDVGAITQLQPSAKNAGAVLGVHAQGLFSSASRSDIGSYSLDIGSSVSVSGVCLTITNWHENSACFDLSAETLRCTTFGVQGALGIGSKVNLEKSLRVGEPLDGHFVQGHVDDIAQVLGRTEKGNATQFDFDIPKSIRRYLIPKGAIAIDGVSLTVANVSDSSFSVVIIPQTLRETTFANLELGQFVNVEADCIAKYVGAMLTANGERKS